MREIELKYRLHAPQAMRARLSACGFMFAGRVSETNQLFDDPAGNLRRAGKALRLRSSTPLKSTADSLVNSAAREGRDEIHTFTYKGPATPGHAKSREEVETQVADADQLRLILARIGFNPILEYRKTRETWVRDNCEVTLDELAGLGWFLEIEGKSEEQVVNIAKELQLSDDCLERRSYAELTRSAPLQM